MAMDEYTDCSMFIAFVCKQSCSALVLGLNEADKRCPPRQSQLLLVLDNPCQ